MQRLAFALPDMRAKLSVPLFSTRIRAGIPAPADEERPQRIDLNRHIIKNPLATFFIFVQGDSMIEDGIRDGDLLVVDRSLPVRNGSVVIAYLDGEFTVKRYKQERGRLYLVPANPDFASIEIKKDQEFEVWGVVKTVIHSF